MCWLISLRKLVSTLAKPLLLVDRLPPQIDSLETLKVRLVEFLPFSNQWFIVFIVFTPPFTEISLDHEPSSLTTNH
ncbi:hypothetical protein CEXT_703681 [Caerostris extrusa]|uniref:Uncharacterized protein n=1 Tax=Caerostris extrusa TaxID=172846 RepID=A0AAV4MEU3_CAEEX|nr:hypothetical protein CEXT_703681 [Caerostris extrusa]